MPPVLPPKLSEAQILGMLAENEDKISYLEQDLNQARRRAAAVQGELSQLLSRLDRSTEAQRERERVRDRAARELNDGNAQVAQLHQMVAALSGRSEAIKAEMNVLGSGSEHRRLRRERAKLRLQIEDREAEIEAQKSRVEKAREQLRTSERTGQEESARARVLGLELERLQSQLPNPHRLAQLFQWRLGRAHCGLLLSGDVDRWSSEIADASALIFELHRDLRTGKYRLDRSSDLLAGRSSASVDAIYALVAIDASSRSLELAALVLDETMQLDQIDNVFRAWCLRYLILDDHEGLSRLLRRHQYADGTRGGYVHAFVGLVSKSADRLNYGLSQIVRHEWEHWNASALRSVGTVNVAAVALGRIASARGLGAGAGVAPPGPTVPNAVFRRGLGLSSQR